MKKSKNIIIGALLLAVLMMAVGYSAFASEMTFSGSAEITGEWDVKITNVEVKEVSSGSDAGSPEFTNNTITFDAKLEKPGDKVVYEITITNSGSIDAKLENLQIVPDIINGSTAISYIIINPSNELLAGEETKMQITAQYDEVVTENPDIKTKTITGVIEYVQK